MRSIPRCRSKRRIVGASTPTEDPPFYRELRNGIHRHTTGLWCVDSHENGFLTYLFIILTVPLCKNLIMKTSSITFSKGLG